MTSSTRAAERFMPNCWNATTKEATMNDRQFDQVQEQLPKGARITKTYRAVEGDIRVIAKLPGEAYETRYTVTFENDYPHISLMP